MDACTELGRLLGKEKIKLVENGKSAIKTILDFAKIQGKEKILVQDQGGWLSFRDYARKNGQFVIEVKTDYGIIDLGDLEKKACQNSLLFVSSLSGFFAEQPMKDIARVCKEKNCILVNDSSGSIGTSVAKEGDIAFVSFGASKPVQMKYGACISTEPKDWLNLMSGSFDEKWLVQLENELRQLQKRLTFLHSAQKKIKKDLAAYEIIHKDHPGLNVIVKFKNELEKKELANYCKKKNYPYLLCPKYIRVNENAVSIEVKKL